MKKIAIYGGTFNPIHNGHINFALGIYNMIDLSKVIFVPNNIPPHKNTHIDIENFRIDMCKIAIHKYPFFEVSDIEIKRGGISYTIDTLKQIKSLYPDSQLYLIVGSDMFVTVENWKNAKEIFDLSIICSAPRRYGEIDMLNKYSDKFNKKSIRNIIFDIPSIDISSTNIRNNVRLGKDISEMVPEGVKDYIYINNLYV